MAMKETYSNLGTSYKAIKEITGLLQSLEHLHPATCLRLLEDLKPICERERDLFTNNEATRATPEEIDDGFGVMIHLMWLLRERSKQPPFVVWVEEEQNDADAMG